MSHTALKLELPSWWRLHNAYCVSPILRFRITSNLSQDPPDLDAIVTDEHELGYDLEVYKEQTGYEVVKIMGSQLNTEWMRVYYLVEWKGNPEAIDRTEEL